MVGAQSCPLLFLSVGRQRFCGVCFCVCGLSGRCALILLISGLMSQSIVYSTDDDDCEGVCVCGYPCVRHVCVWV